MQPGGIFTLTISSRFRRRSRKPGSSRSNSRCQEASYGNLRQIGIGSPVFTEGQEYVLFLWTSRSGMTQVIGLTQGMYNLTQDASGAAVLNRPAIADQMLDKSGTAVTDSGVTIKWSELRDLIVKTLPRQAAAK